MMYPMDDIWLKGHLACTRDRMQIVEAFDIVCGRIIRMLLCCLLKKVSFRRSYFHHYPRTETFGPRPQVFLIIPAVHASNGYL